MPTLAQDKHLVEKDEVKLPRVHFLWHTPALYADGDAALDLLSSVLTDGKTSRLYKPLVYEQKVASDVSAYQVSMAIGSFYVVQATAAPGKSLDEVISSLDTALQTALATPPTDDEMTRVVNGWKKSFFGRVESVLGRARLLSNYFHLTGSPDYLAQDLARYTQVSAAQVHGEAQKWLGKKRVRIDITPVEKPKAPAAASKGGAK
jgi:zinc protease